VQIHSKKLKDRSTATNLLDEELLKDVIKKSKKRREERKGSSFGNSE
jgi:hypothetical protein